MLGEEARRELLNVARRSVEAAVRGKDPPEFDCDDPDLQEERGAFVTLKTDGRLRGCIGQFVAEQPLWRVVRRMAVAAATQDPRFFSMRLRPDELQDLEVEISVLSPLRQVEDPMEEITLGKHGIQIRRGARTGCFLPQVATETGWSKEEFLCRCCGGKAGLDPYAWQGPETEVCIFTAEVFSG